MVKINRIYTRTGDDGTTGLVGGKRVKKDAARVQAYGDVDELMSFLGWAHTLAEKQSRKAITSKLSTIQNELFDAGSELATPPGESYEGMVTITDAQVTRLEGWIDELVDGMPELRSFMLPGGTELNSLLHVCRTVCRRAERSIISLANAEQVSAPLQRYFNRLSDLFFAMARYELHIAKVPEILWKPGASRF